MAATLLLPLLALWLRYCVFQVAASTLSTFSDTQCQKSLQSLPGNNGYPDGLCTNFHQQASVQYSSFMIVQLDDGCSVTLYGPNATPDPCSATVLEVGAVGVCYNTSWVYYSVDLCTSPSLIPTTSGAAPTSSGGASGSSSDGGGGSHTNTGAIAGGVVGGLAMMGLIAAAIFFFWIRPLRKKLATASGNEQQATEVPTDGAAAVAAAAAGRPDSPKDEKPPAAEVPANDYRAQELSDGYVAEVPANYYGENQHYELDGSVPAELPEKKH